jgi:ABC-type sugar transport system substrate-binding protein
LQTTPIEAGWTTESGRLAVRAWLRIATRAQRRVDVLACQNDALAEGALQALDLVGPELGRPDLGQLPVIGCDGTPSMGQALVRQGRLAGTVVLPRASGHAIELLARTLRGGERPPIETFLHGTPFALGVDARLPPTADDRRVAR